MGDPRKFILETGFSIDSRSEKYGLEQLLLDDFGNHRDSGGKFQGIDVVQDGLRIPLDLIDSSKPVQQYYSYDDGAGFAYENLFLIHSDKDDKESVGYFGKGLKMMACAALRHGLHLEYGSRDWKASAISKESTLLSKDGTPIRHLCFEIETGCDPIVGAYTRILDPPEELVRLAHTLDSRLLEKKPLPQYREF